MQTSKELKKEYTPNESRMRKLLDSKFTSSDELIEKWFEGVLPYNAREIVVNTINRLDRKMNWNNDPFEIEKRRPGSSMEVRIKRRGKNEVRNNRPANDAGGVRRGD